MPSGIRKSGKISALKELNRKLKLGMSDSDIESMSTNLLRKTIYNIKKKHGIKIQAHAKKFED